MHVLLDVQADGAGAAVNADHDAIFRSDLRSISIHMIAKVRYAALCGWMRMDGPMAPEFKGRVALMHCKYSKKLQLANS